MTTQEIKSKGILVEQTNSAKMYFIYPTYFMVSEKTGIHAITTKGGVIDSRVKAHWNGFKANQNK